MSNKVIERVMNDEVKKKIMLLKVSDIKQYIYCPRIIYFTYVTPVPKKKTYKMETGMVEHLEFERLEKRRTLRAYQIKEGKRYFRTPLFSSRLGLQGILDLHIATPVGYLPVEVKHSTRKPSLNHKYQLIAYAMLLEEKYAKPVRHGFIYLILQKKTYIIEITPNTRAFLKRMLIKMRRLVEQEIFPPPPRHRGRCVDCEYRNYCGDL